MDKHRFNLVLPNEIWQRLKALAERNRRPITQEIILAILARLEKDQYDNTLQEAKILNKRIKRLDNMPDSKEDA